MDETSGTATEGSLYQDGQTYNRYHVYRIDQQESPAITDKACQSRAVCHESDTGWFDKISLTAEVCVRTYYEL